MRHLPTGARMQKRGGLEDERCCSCGASIECDDHLFQCNARPQYKRKLFRLINNMDQSLDPKLREILQMGLRDYMNVTIPITTSIDEKGNKTVTRDKIWQAKEHKGYGLVITSQTKIVWDNLLCGKLSTEWRKHQRLYENKQKYKQKQRDKKRILNPYINNVTKGDKTKKRKTDIFQKLINDIFNLCEEEMWTQRNLDRHQPKNKSRYTETVKVD